MSCQAPFQRGISYKCRTPAIDSDVGYHGAEFKSVCCKYSDLSLSKKMLSIMDNGFCNQCIIFGTCEMQLLNLSRIFDRFSRIFGKVVFNLKQCRIQLIQTSHLKAVTSRIILGTCEIQRLNQVMITVSSIPQNTGRYALIHKAVFIFL